MSFILETTTLNSEKSCQFPILQQASFFKEDATNAVQDIAQEVFTFGLLYAQSKKWEAEDIISNAKKRALSKLEHPVEEIDVALNDKKAKRKLQCLVAGIAVITFGAIAAAFNMTYRNL